MDEKVIFCFGSRAVTVIPKEVLGYLETFTRSGVEIYVGDANGADKAFQKYFASKSFQNVTVFTSLEEPRNNIGNWPIRSVTPAKKLKGHEIHQAKDIAASKTADAGLVLWDGSSIGTLLSALLILLNHGTVKMWVHDGTKQFLNFYDTDGFYTFIDRRSPASLAGLLNRFKKISDSSSSNVQPSLFE